MKHGKLPFLVLPEISNNGQVMKIHLIYRKLGSRGVVVEIDRAEKFRVDNLLKELREKGAKNIKFIYKGYRICGAKVVYEDGSIENIDKETAETLRFLYVLGKNEYVFLKSIKLMQELVKE